MHNTLNLIIILLLLTGTSFAEASNRAETMDLLAAMEGAEQQEQTAAPAAANDAATMDQSDVPALIEESREYYVAGEFQKAQRGFEQAVKLEPDHTEARMYLKILRERDVPAMKKDALKEVREEWDTSLVLRTYPISPDAAEAMQLNEAEDSIPVEHLFPEVSFPKGASAVYHPSTEKIFVRNTRENLTVVEAILSALDVSKQSADVDQIEIEAKFIEVSAGTLEELGFEWRSADGRDISLAEDWAYDGSYFLYNDALRGTATGPDMPFDRPGSLEEGERPADSGDWTASRFKDTFSADPADVELQFRGGTELDILISALDQSSGTDVLSAPRVVTKSGKKAVIRVGDLHHYPEVYEVGASEGNIVHVRYEDFSEKLLGVELEVTPQANGELIELGLHPKVTELLGWQSYSVAPADSAYTYYQWRLGFEFEHDPIVAGLPVYKIREIQTEVTIADGSTIGMGGLISEEIESFEDKVPILGNIPFIGRLFRSEGERALQRNLIMFVTARKMNPNGQINFERSFGQTNPPGADAE